MTPIGSSAPPHFYATRNGQRRRVTPFTLPPVSKTGRPLKRYRFADGTVLERRPQGWLIDAQGVRWRVCGERRP